ncbi:MAG: DNRLRE domain-containing protein [Byssovorax sp.]
MQIPRNITSRVLVTLAIPLSPMLFAGCTAEPSAPPEETGAAASLLRAHFPAEADRVLTSRGTFSPTPEGFEASLSAELSGNAGLRATLPVQGEGALALRAPGGASFTVHEIGAFGEAEESEGALAYHRASGTSFWSVVPGGVEEWLRIDAGGLGEQGLAASWSIEGATPRQAGEAVEITDAAGAVRARVTAPAAFAAGSRPIGAHLRVEGSTIVLYVDPTADEVLVDPMWVASPSMAIGRFTQASVALADGRVLVAGGVNSSGYLTSAEIYDPVTATWSATGSLNEARGQFTMSLLPNGQVLVVGGFAGQTSPTSVEMYDPATGTFSIVGSIGVRSAHTATTLTDGRILIAGGNSGSGILMNGMVYDPATATWTVTGAISKPHQAHAATRLADGRVLITGNNSGNNTTTQQMGADIYNPATNTWSPAATGYMKSARYWHVSGLLPSGKVIIAGGGTGFNGYSSSAEVYDPVANTFTTVASMGTARAQASSMIMPDGTFLVAGGYSGSATLATTQRYDGTTNTWIASGSMLNPHYGASTAMLPGNYVLVAAGNGGLNSYSSLTDQYSPLGAPGASCTSNSECVSGFCTDGVCCTDACAGGDTDCRACSVAAGGAQNGVCGWVVTNVNACNPTCTTFQRGTLGDVPDTHIVAGSPTANFGTATLLSLGLSGTERRVLISSDVSSIPAGSMVTSATLMLKAGGGSTTVLRAHQSLAPWAENTVTWNSFNNSFDPAVLASSTYSTTTALYSIDLTSIVQGWVNGTTSNYGILIERNLDSTNNLYSSNNATVAYRPKLQVCTMAHP